MGEDAALVTLLSMLPIHTLLSPVLLYTPLASLALPSCCILFFCHAICPHTSFQSGFCSFLFFFSFFFGSLQLHGHSLHSAPPWCLSLLATHSGVPCLPVMVDHEHELHSDPATHLQPAEAYSGCFRDTSPFSSSSTGHKIFWKQKYPSVLLKGLQLTVIEPQNALGWKGPLEVI